MATLEYIKKYSKFYNQIFIALSRKTKLFSLVLIPTLLHTTNSVIPIYKNYTGLSTNNLATKSYEIISQSNSYKRLCTDDPSISYELMTIGRQLGVITIYGQPDLPGKDATYRAINGRLGVLKISNRAMAPHIRCQLISHEFIHVLQHLSQNLKGVEPIGWDITTEAIIRFGSRQEAEAYTYQNQAEMVLILLKEELNNRQ